MMSLEVMCLYYPNMPDYDPIFRRLTAVSGFARTGVDSHSVEISRRDAVKQ
jgi:hypothetical protein